MVDRTFHSGTSCKVHDDELGFGVPLAGFETMLVGCDFVKASALAGHQIVVRADDGGKVCFDTDRSLFHPARQPWIPIHIGDDRDQIPAEFLINDRNRRAFWNAER